MLFTTTYVVLRPSCEETCLWNNPGGIGHVVVVRPNLSGDGEVHIAQAGANDSDGLLSANSSSDFVQGVGFIPMIEK